MVNHFDGITSRFRSCNVVIDGDEHYKINVVVNMFYCNKNIMMISCCLLAIRLL